MADRFDVASRLAEGRDAVERMQVYVQACHALGYQQPELTAAHVQACYDAESGLDLTALGDDCTALRAAVNALDEALWVQRAQVTELATGWRGSGADAAMRFLQQHCDSAAQLAAQVRSAAEGCAALRDNLWRSVDGKVATTIAVDERHAAQRPAWLAAAHTVTAGVGERPAAEEMIRRQVIPYVDNDIRHDWLSAMHSTAESVTAAYDAAIQVLTSAPEVRFEVPGELGPSGQPPPLGPSRQPPLDEPGRAVPVGPAMPDLPMPADPPPTAPAAAQTPPPPATMPDSQPPSAAAAGDVPPELGSSLGDAAGLGGLGGIAGGIGGVIGNIVDGISSLIGSLAGNAGGAAGSGDPLLDDDPVDAEHIADPSAGDEDDPPADDDATEDTKAEPVNADAEEPADQLTETPPAAAEAIDEPTAPPPLNPPSPADQLPPVAGPPPDGSTPCEIAEDQLPQAGQ